MYCKKQVLSEHYVSDSEACIVRALSEAGIVRALCQKQVLSEHCQKQVLSENFIREPHFQFLMTLKNPGPTFFLNTDFQGLSRPCERAFKTFMHSQGP